MGIMKGAVVVGGITLVAGSAFLYGRLKTLFEQNSNLILYIPGRAFYVLGLYPFDGSHQEDVEELSASLDAIYDEQTVQDEIQHFNGMYFDDFFDRIEE